MEKKELWLLVGGMLGLMLALQWCGAPAYALLRYERGMAALQPWRLVSAHWVHLGAWHCALNMVGLAAWAALAAAGTWRANAVAALILCAAVGAVLPLLPRVADYAGFSGVLYGLFAWSFASRALAGQRMFAAALALLAARIAWQLAGPAPIEEEALIGGTVLAQAHLAGALAGCLIALAARLRKRDRALVHAQGN